MYKKSITRFIILSHIFFCAACGQSGLLYTTPHDADLSLDASVGRFALGGDFPANLIVSNVSGLEHVALVVSTESPAGLVALDVAGTTLSLAAHVRGCIVPDGDGIPAGPLAVVSADRVLFATSSHLIDCNPLTGEIRAALAFADDVALGDNFALSTPYDVNGDGVSEFYVNHVTPQYPGGMARDGATLYVSFANYVVPTGDVVAAPGTIVRYDILNAAPFLRRASTLPIVSSYYNPTGLTMLANGTLLVVETGVNTIAHDATVPLTQSAIEVINPQTLERRTSPLGAVALSFQSLALTADASRAFIGSAAYGEMYVLNLTTMQWERDHATPIRISNGSDFITSSVMTSDTHVLWSGSFTTSQIVPIDLQSADYALFPSSFPHALRVGFPAGVTAENPTGANTGVSAMARDGNVLLVATAHPGEILAIALNAEQPLSAIAVTPTPKSSSTMVMTPPPLSMPTANALNIGISASPSPSPSLSVAPHPSASAFVLPPPGVTPTPSLSVTITPTPTPSAAPAIPAPQKAISACSNPFADAVVSLVPSCAANARFGCGSMPGIVLGGPKGGGLQAGGLDVLSLGCGGQILVEFKACWILDGPGADFIVFENAFKIGATNSTFVEPGIVGVSKDGVNFVEFACGGKASNYAGCAGTHPVLANVSNNAIDPTDPQHAGGDAFDLSAVKLPYARFVRIRDVSCTNSTAPTAGFDLDAVSAVWGAKPW